MKIFSIHLFFVVIAAAFYWMDPYGPNLVWNMFLALVALDLAYWASRVKNRVILGLLVLLWLLFYPNTFYMLTDVVYFTWADQILVSNQALVNFTIFMSSILFGVLSGVYSWHLIVDRFRIQSSLLRYGLIVVLSVVSSFAIHIGRYARLNSWDMFTQPRMVLEELLSVVSWSALPFMLTFIFFQVMILIFTDRESL